VTGSFDSPPAIRRKMSLQRSHNTGPEVALRSALHRRGLRFRVHQRPLPDLRREADIVFRRAKVAVFVDGCFWHGCPEHGRRVHAANSWYWPDKIARNKARDLDTDQRLRNGGWRSVRVWEHEAPELAAAAIAEHLATELAGSRRAACP
jgi:DNA mismatch endonuclease (patch repair protein)